MDTETPTTRQTERLGADNWHAGWFDCMQPLRVLHVTPYAGNAWAYGGIPRVADALARGLAARGHHVTLCTTDACDGYRRLTARNGYRQGRDSSPWPATDGVDLQVFPNVSNWLAYRQGFVPVGLARYLKQSAGAFDVAHLHACRNLPGVIAARYLRAAGVPYVLAPNGTALNLEQRRVPKQVFDLLFGRRVVDGAASVLAVTQAERRQLSSLGIGIERIAVVPNPVALEEFDPLPRRGDWRQRLGIRGPIVAYLGTLTPRKRVDLLVQAFADVGVADATLVVAGNDMGSERATRTVARQRQVEERTRFIGLLEGRARLQLLCDADVVVYPSEREVFGLVPLESLLVGTPVVVANDSGCGEVVSAVGGGLVVPGHHGALRAAIEQILLAPARWRAAAAEAAGRVRATYATEIVCSQLEWLYREVVAAR